MAQNITIAGATFNAVPSIVVPTSNNGSAIFVDPSPTTAVDSDVASGKVYFKSDGSQSTGTASGGGGASNVVMGSFTAGSEAGDSDISISYTGSGYPIAAIIYPKGGLYNTSWYDTISRYAVVQWAMTKCFIGNSVPDYSSDSDINYAAISAITKSSTSNANACTAAYGKGLKLYNSNGGVSGSSATNVVVFKSATTMQIRTKAASNYGFMQNCDYDYIIIYSS